jgi:hypothetical protein
VTADRSADAGQSDSTSGHALNGAGASNTCDPVGAADKRDDDGDGVPNCADACPDDANKTRAGACGCGKTDTDRDADGTLDCDDECPDDKRATDEGACGCGVVETDSDGDDVANCVDACPFDPATSADGDACGFAFTASNIDPTSLDATSVPALTTIGCAATLDTSGAAPTFTAFCPGKTAPALTIVAQSQAGAPELAVWVVNDLSIPAGGSLRVTGSRPLVIVAFGSADIAGEINAAASFNKAGAGGSVSCGVGAGPDGNDSDSDAYTAGSGGGGGGFGSAGGVGGAAMGACCVAVGGGKVEAAPELVPLRGGCDGGRGGRSNVADVTDTAVGGAGGGALQLTVAGMLSVQGTISVSGGGGRHGANNGDGGGGGGSGGALLLEAGDIVVAQGAWLTANGGSGAGGNPRSYNQATDGQDGLWKALTPAPGGLGYNDSGAGGPGATNAAGGDGASAVGQNGRAGGGGGGGHGRIMISANSGCSMGGHSSPPAIGCN